jgi:phage shock protein C
METTKTLHRIKNGKEVLGGVCLGLGEHFNMDPLIFRIAFVLLLIFPLPSIIPYMILWAVLPKKYAYNSVGYNYSADTNSSDINEPESNLEYNLNNNTMNTSKGNNNGGLIGGAVLIVLGIIFSVKEYADINLFHYIGKAWPLFFIGLGAWMILRDKDKTDNF